MKPTEALYRAGQSLWLDNITRAMLRDGTLERYVREYSLTGLTSNPTIFDRAIEHGAEYDHGIRELSERGLQGEALFFELALEDLRQAADLFAGVHQRTDGVDGWVSLEVSPLLAYDAEATIEEVRRLHAQAGRPNVFIKIPGTQEGLRAIEESIFAGIPVNVTLLFSAEQYQAAADAYLRGLERRVEAGLNPAVPSVASIFVSRWDRAVADRVPEELRGQLGIAEGKRAYRAYRELLDSHRWLRLANVGARPQRLLWASTSTKDPRLSDVLYVEALASPFTINTMPDETLLAFADHGRVSGMLPQDGGDAEVVLARFTRAGVDREQLAAQLQQEGAKAFDDSWSSLLRSVQAKSEKLGVR
jgi:transaldolase